MKIRKKRLCKQLKATCLCRGGPYHNQYLRLDASRPSTGWFTVRGETGRYVGGLNTVTWQPER